MTEGVTVLHLSNRERDGRDEESAFIYSGEKERENERLCEREREGGRERERLCEREVTKAEKRQVDEVEV